MITWKDLKNIMEEDAYTVQVKGRGKTEYICSKGKVIVDLVRIDTSWIEIWIYDTITDEMTYNVRIRPTMIGKHIPYIFSEVDFINAQYDV